MTTDPQIFYVSLVIPGILGLTLLGEGINKIIHEEWKGIISVIFGLVAIAATILGYLYFSSLKI